MKLLKDSASRVILKFANAFSGWKYSLFTDHSIQLQIGLGVLTVLAGLVLRVRGNDWLWLFSAIVIVIGFEAINSCIESLCDLVSLARDERIKRIKDMGSGFVLLAALYAIVVGISVFSRYL